MKKILIIIGLGLLVIGYFVLNNRAGKIELVENKELNVGYDKMNVGENGINGYILQLNIFGLIDGERIFESVKIRNYMDQQFEITIMDDSEPEDLEEDFEYIMNDEIYYIVDGETYVENELGKYEKTNQKVKYNDPSIYLLGVKNIIVDGEKEEEYHGEHKYYTYDVVINKKIVQEMLDTTNISYQILEDVSAKVYLDSEGYIYRIVYEIDSLTMQVSFFTINNSFPIYVPLEDY